MALLATTRQQPQPDRRHGQISCMCLKDAVGSCVPAQHGQVMYLLEDLSQGITNEVLLLISFFFHLYRRIVKWEARLIGIHVALSAAASLPDDQREVLQQLPLRHLCGRLHDGLCLFGVQRP